MNKQKIIDILRAHSIDFVCFPSGKIFAWEYGTIDGAPYERQIEVTDYNITELLSWLGY